MACIKLRSASASKGLRSIGKLGGAACAASAEVGEVTTLRRIFRACIGWRIDCNRGPESNFAFRTYRSACLMRKAVNLRNCAPDQAASNGAPMRDALGLKSLAKSA